MVDWEWYRNVNTCHLFVYCIFAANWRDGRFEGVEVPRGSFVTSYARLSEATGLSIQNVRTALKHLKITGELTVNQHSKFSVITVKNYSLYQISNSQLTGDQQATNRQLTTIEERKKERREESITDTTVSVRPSEAGRIIERWNQLERFGIKPIVKITPTSKRHQNLQARIREYGIDDILKGIERIEHSDFLQGKSKRGWVINFDWFILPTNFAKVLEGRYDNKDEREDGGKRTVFDEWRDA